MAQSEAFVEAAGTVEEVKQYAERIQAKVKEVGLFAKSFTADLQQKIKELFEALQPTHRHIYSAYGTVGDTESNTYHHEDHDIILKDHFVGTGGRFLKDDKKLKTESTKRLEEALKLQKLAKEISDQRLDELVAETELAFDRVKNSAGLTVDDISSLNGCLDSWKKQENLSFKMKQEEDKRRNDEAKRERDQRQKKREDEERQRQRNDEVMEKPQEKENERREEKRKHLDKKKKLLQEMESRRQEEESEERDEKLRRQKEEDERRVEERRKKVEERQRAELAEQNRKKQEEARRQAEKERQEREDRIRRQKEKEDRELKEREDRERQEEEERKRKEKEKLDKEIQLKREREEREREQKRLANEEKKRQLEEKRKEQERMKQEEEARKQRQNPENWSPIIYERPDQVDGDKSYHKGICCIVLAPEGSFKYDDAEGIASDEVDDVIEVIPPGERMASSVIRLSSTRGEIRPEVPLRVHVPHVSVTDAGEEVVIMYSLNDSDHWTTKYPTNATKKAVTSENVNLSSLEVKAFETLKMVAVVRQKGEVLIVDHPGKWHQIDRAKNSKLHFERETFMEPTEVRITVKPIHLNDAASVLTPADNVLQEIISVSPLYTIHSQRPPLKNIKFDVSRNTGKVLIVQGTKPRGRVYKMYRTRDGQWRMAQSEVNGNENDVSVSLPPYKGACSFLEIETSTQRSQEEMFKAAEALFSLATMTIVRVLTRQQSADPFSGVLHIVSRDACDRRIQELSDRGFDFGGSCSSAFCLQDGDKIQARISGNIGFAAGVVEPIVLTFLTFIDRARMHLKFVVKDQYSQRDFVDYVGRLICGVVSRKQSTQTGDGLKIELPIHLPKKDSQKGRTPIKFVPVRFPYYLTGLTTYLAMRLSTREDVEWIDVMKRLDTEKKIKQLERRARNKCDVGEETKVCRTVLLDWMKAQPRHIDKVKPILDALKDSQILDLHDECKTFVEYFREILSDEKLRDVISGVTGSPTEIGQALGFTERQIEEIIKPDTSGPSEKRFMLIAEWRETDRAVESGLGAFEVLQSALSKCKT